MWPIATDGMVWSVSLYVTGMRPAKTAEPIEMPFGMWVLVSPHNHELYGGLDPPEEGAILGWRRDQPIVEYRDHGL